MRFYDGMRTLASSGMGIFLELGPRPVLCGLGAATLDSLESRDACLWLPSLRPAHDEVNTILKTLSEFHIRHFPVQWKKYFELLNCQHVELPTYAFPTSTL